MPRVLVVDDEADAVELLREFLTTKGSEVLAASKGEDALRKVKEDRPHLILLDVRMPKMNGLEDLKQVWQIDQEVGVTNVTTVNEVETGRQALKLGGFDDITKPLDLKHLEEVSGTRSRP